MGALKKIRGLTQIMLKSITRGQIADETIQNLQIATDAAIATSKLADGANLIKRDGAGSVTVSGDKITNVGAPAADTDAVNRGYVLAQVAALGTAAEFKNSALSRLATPPSSPSTGARYLIIATATGDWAGKENQIAEWNGAAWEFTVCTTGTYIAIDDETNCIYYFGGSTWTKRTFADNFVDGEEPTVTADSPTVTLAYTPLSGTEKVYVNGMRQSRGSNYTIAGAVITFEENLLDGDSVIVDYRK